MPPQSPCALMVLYDFAPSITLYIMLQGLSFTHSGRFLRKVPDPGGPLMRTSIIGAKPPVHRCSPFQQIVIALCPLFLQTI